MVRDEARTVRTVVGGFTLTLAVFALAGVRLDPGANEPAAAALRLNLAAQELSRGAAKDAAKAGDRGPGFSTKELDLNAASNGVASADHPAGSDLVAHSGGDASQTGKHTWAASDPERVAAFWLDLLPTSPWMIGNYSVDGGCATYGKVFVGNDSTTGVHGVNAPFQLHAVRAWKRSSGALSMAELESKFSNAISRWGFDGQATREQAALPESAAAPPETKDMSAGKKQQAAPPSEPLALQPKGTTEHTEANTQPLASSLEQPEGAEALAKKPAAEKSSADAAPPSEPLALQPKGTTENTETAAQPLASSLEQPKGAEALAKKPSTEKSSAAEAPPSEPLALQPKGTTETSGAAAQPLAGKLEPQRRLDARARAGADALARADAPSGSGYATHALPPLAENVVGLYTEDLSYYARALTASGYDFAVLAWEGSSRDAPKGAEGAQFHSLVVHVPDTLVVLELMGPAMDAATSKAVGRAQPSWRRVAAALPPSTHVETLDARGKPSLTAVKISYSSTDAARDSAWAERVLEATPLSRDVTSADYPAASFDDRGALAGSSAFGVDARVLSWTSDLSPVELHYVEPSNSAQSVEHALSADERALSVEAYETYAVKTHLDLVDKCEACDDVTGFDRLMDTHFGRRLLSAGGAEARTLDAAFRAAVDLDAPHTVWKKGAAYFLYVASPSGAAAQLTGTFDDAPAGARQFNTCVA